MNKPMAEMTTVEMCEYFMAMNCGLKKSIRVLLEIVDKQEKEANVLRKDLQNANLQGSESWNDVEERLYIFHAYRQWAEKRLQEL